MQKAAVVNKLECPLLPSHPVWAGSGEISAGLVAHGAWCREPEAQPGAIREPVERLPARWRGKSGAFYDTREEALKGR
jgi:hypothetical protein